MDTWDRVVGWINNCAANTEVENLKDAVDKGTDAMLIAEGVSSFVKRRPQAARVFRQAREGLGEVREGLSKVQGSCLDLRAAAQIQSAIRILKQDGIIQRKPDLAARAFGDLFSGFGQLAAHLPPPASIYAPVLQKCGGDFFVNVKHQLDPKGSEQDWRAAMEN